MNGGKGSGGREGGQGRRGAGVGRAKGVLGCRSGAEAGDGEAGPGKARKGHTGDRTTPRPSCSVPRQERGGTDLSRPGPPPAFRTALGARPASGQHNKGPGEGRGAYRTWARDHVARGW